METSETRKQFAGYLVSKLWHDQIIRLQKEKKKSGSFMLSRSSLPGFPPHYRITRVSVLHFPSCTSIAGPNQVTFTP